MLLIVMVWGNYLTSLKLNMTKETIFTLSPYPQECLNIPGHEKLRRNGLVPQSMKELDNKCKKFNQNKCPNCGFWVVWTKKEK